LDVWSITCPPCRLTIPELIAVQKELGGIDFMVIGLSLDEDLPAVKKFLDKESSNYHTVQATAEIMKKLPPVRGIPTLFLLDAKGKILKTYVGYTTRDVFKKDIRNLLNK